MRNIALANNWNKYVEVLKLLKLFFIFFIFNCAIQVYYQHAEVELSLLIWGQCTQPLF